MKALLLPLAISLALGTMSCSDRSKTAGSDPWPDQRTSGLDFDPYGSTRQPGPAEGRGDMYRAPHAEVDVED